MSDNAIAMATWDRAVQDGAGSQDYDAARKLTALALAEQNPAMTGGEAAIHADRCWFLKTILHAVANGLMTAENAFSQWIDRLHAAAVSFTETTLPVLVVSGCTIAGTWIGSLFGNPILGGKLGTSIGTFLNKPVQEAVLLGLNAIKDFAKRAFEKIKEWAGEKTHAIAQGVANRATSLRN